jgi:hypothetical protein
MGMPASKAPFLPSSRLVAPIVCMECGGNAYCIQRAPDPGGLPFERRIFECVVCHKETRKDAGPEPSDAEIQRAAERLTGRSKTEQ